MGKISIQTLQDTCTHCIADPMTGSLRRMVFEKHELNILRYHRHTLGSRGKAKGRDLILLECEEGVFVVSQTWWEHQPYPFQLVQQLSSDSESLFNDVKADLAGHLKRTGLNTIEKPAKLEKYYRYPQEVPPSPFQ